MDRIYRIYLSLTSHTHLNAIKIAPFSSNKARHGQANTPTQIGRKKGKKIEAEHFRPNSNALQLFHCVAVCVDILRIFVGLLGTYILMFIVILCSFGCCCLVH